MHLAKDKTIVNNTQLKKYKRQLKNNMKAI